ncbi:tetratricopeptide repeat protein 17-like isoform X2 [Tubulanus polymorphus]|uniref:tetratricopeptide repeat protein 17-like isoform X2 n=1 Tax=Tubulanus polymorphus TaxID=672921 RepID=UPI003DA66BCB
MTFSITNLVFILLIIIEVQGTTHWIVTEDGRLQAQVDSLFNLRRPYDLVALLKQEERADLLERLKGELITQKQVIDKNEDKDVGLEQRFYKTNVDCQLAGKPLPEFDLYISTVLPLENKGIRPEEHLSSTKKSSAIPQSGFTSPKCVEIIPLEYSIHSFEHLEGIKNRHNLTGSPELGVRSALTSKEKVDEYGHAINEALLKNRTSWVLYNLAAFYWRFKGNPYQVVECLRRALHYSPQHEKDIAQISLANILHRARYSTEAAIVVHAALDISKELNVNHFTLGNIYAVLGDYNKSVVCFENTLKIQPDFEAAAKRRHAVLCHAQLEAALEAQHESLQRTLEDLRNYQEKHEYFQREQDKLFYERMSEDVRLNQHVYYERYKNREHLMRGGQTCQLVEKDGRNILKCSWGRREETEPTDDLDAVSFYEAEKERKETYKKQLEEEKEKEMQASAPSTTTQSITDYEKPIRPPLYYKKHPEPPSATNLPYRAPHWPLLDDCKSTKYPAWTDFPPAYLPAENKGFEVKALLSSVQGLGLHDEHPLPWYPPSCVDIDDITESPNQYDHFQPIQERAKESAHQPDTDAKQWLLHLVDKHDTAEEDIGQRILTALRKKIGAKWIMYNLAALFWRVQGNFFQSIECIRRSLAFVKDQYRDVPLVNLASILYKHGHIPEALQVVNDVLKINDLEPATNFMMGHLLSVKGNFTGALYHYREALRQDPFNKEIIEIYTTVACKDKFQPPKPAEQQQQEPTVFTPNMASCQYNDHQTESRVVCNTDQGREICVVETRTRRSTGNTHHYELKDPKCGMPKPDARVNTVRHCSRQCCSKCSAKPSCSSSPASSNNNNNIRENSPPRRHVPVVKKTNNTPQQREVPTMKAAASADNAQPVRTGSNDKKNDVVGPDVDVVVPEDKKVESEPDISTMSKTQEKPEQLPVPTANNDVKGPTGPSSSASPSISMKQSTTVMSVEKLESSPVAAPTVEPAPFKIIVDGKQVMQLKKLLRKYSYCSGIDCQTIIFQHGIIMPNIKINFVKGKLQRKLSYRLPPEIQYGVNDCVVFIDGVTTPGCDTIKEFENEKQEAIKFREEFMQFEVGVKSQVNNVCPLSDAPGAPAVTQCITQVTRVFYGIEMPDILEAELPDAMEHIESRLLLSWPTWEECQQNPQGVTKINQFTSTWLSVTTKSIEISAHVDLKSDLTSMKPGEPSCDSFVKFDPSIDTMDHLRGVQQCESLSYSPEIGLKDVLQQLMGGNNRDLDDIGTIIAHSMQQNDPSWVVANLAALYWRVKGHAANAVSCIRLALHLSPYSVSDIALVSLANVLHRAGRINDAIIANSIALDISPKLVVIHFTMANIYAAKKSDLQKAILFYESTLGLQSGFEPAKTRLRAVQCFKVLANPHKYKKQRNP